MSSRLLAVGEPELAWRVLLPCQVPVQRRVPVMVAVGALVMGLVGSARFGPARHRPMLPLSSLAQCLIRAGAEVDGARIGELIAAHRTGGVLVDVLVELVKAAGRPLVELPPSTIAPGGRPVPGEVQW